MEKDAVAVKAKRKRTPVKPTKPTAVTRPMVKAASLGGNGPKFNDAVPRRGSSQQIPIEIMQRTANEIIVPPLGENSFEDLAKLTIESSDFATIVEQQSIDVAGSGWHLDPVDQDQPMDPTEVKAAMAFLAMPNPTQTLGEIFKAAYQDFATIGNAWIEVLRERDDPNGKPAGLVHAPGIAMRLRSNMYGHVMLALDMARVAFFRPLFSDPDDPRAQAPAGSFQAGRPLNEMMFFRRYHSGSPWYGIPKIVPAIPAIKGSMYSAERNIRFFLNRAMPEWVVLITGETDNIPQAQLEVLQQEIEQHFVNVLKGDDYRTLYLELPIGVSIKFEKISIDVDDATHPVYRKDNRDEIFRVMNMMPNRCGIIESGNIGGGTGESQIEIYKSSLTKPGQEMFERPINAILHAEVPKGLGLRTVAFKFDEIDSVDEEREASIAGMISATGWMTINEGRAYVSQFLKTHLDPIDEAWADLPLQIVLPQLATLLPPFESMQEDPGFNASVSPLGTPVLPGTPTGAIPMVERVLSIDRAYRHLQARRASRNGG